MRLEELCTLIRDHVAEVETPAGRAQAVEAFVRAAFEGVEGLGLRDPDVDEFPTYELKQAVVVLDRARDAVDDITDFYED